MEPALIIIGACIIIGVIGGLVLGNKDNEFRADSETDTDANSNLNPYNMQETNQEKETEIMENPKYQTQQLVVSTLTQIGCQPIVNEDGSVYVTYQGENFHFVPGFPYLQIWDPQWAIVNVNDPEFPLIREAVNKSNFEFGPTVVMSTPDNSGALYFHSQFGTLFQKETPEIDNHLRDILNMFFTKKDSIRRHWHQISAEQQKAPDPRRPIGFTPTPETTEASD